MKKIVVIDGQGGKMGCLLIEKLKASQMDARIIAIGTNSIATASMLRAGADAGATGENPVLVNCPDADYIAGPIGIIAANSLMGEVTPAMACAAASSPAEKVLIPTSRCSFHVAGIQNQPLPLLVADAANYILSSLLSD